MKNIVLIGFMGTGKTAVAKGVARVSGFAYISTDDLIEKKEGKLINEIFSSKGEPYFRQVEKDIVREVSAMDDIVIDAGGGVVLDPENVKNLKNKGVLVCLWAEPKDIFERTKRHTHRPLLNVKDPLRKITELLDKRRPYYERADYHINTSSVSIADTVDSILKFAGRKDE